MILENTFFEIDSSIKSIQSNIDLTFTRSLENMFYLLAKSQVILVGKDIDLTEKAVIELNKVLPKVTLGEN